MYHNGQIVWSVDKKKPIKVDSSFSGKTRHFIDAEGKVVCPKSIKEANLLLTRGRIIQAPVPSHWCWSCDYWLDKAPLAHCEAENEHITCNECGGFGIYSHRFEKKLCQKCTQKLSKDALQSVAEELLKEIVSCESDNFYPSKISKLIDNLVELNDPGNHRRDGIIRDRLEKILRKAKEMIK